MFSIAKKETTETNRKKEIGLAIYSILRVQYYMQ
jgi:hypothetical protein